MNGRSQRARQVGRSAALVCVSLAQLVACARQHAGRAGYDDDNAPVEAPGSSRGQDDGERAPDDARTGAPIGGGDGRPEPRPTGGVDASVSEPPVSALLIDVFAAYEEDRVARCPCQVESGVYTSFEECEATAAQPRPRIDDCLDRAIPADLSAGVSTWLRCVALAARTHTACIEDSACDEHGDCRLEASRCLFPDASSLSSAFSKCPNAIGSAR